MQYVILTFIGVFFSSGIVLYLVQKNSHSKNEIALSQLVAQDFSDLRLFRIAVFAGGTPIAISVFFYIVPNVDENVSLMFSFLAVYAGEVMLSLIPDKSTSPEIFTFTLHNAFAWAGFFGMIVTPLLLSNLLGGFAAQLETTIFCIMLPLSLAAIIYRKRFLVFELSFVFMSHLSVIVAVLAVYFS